MSYLRLSATIVVIFFLAPFYRRRWLLKRQNPREIEPLAKHTRRPNKIPRIDKTITRN